MISTPFHWHNCRSISRISSRFSSKNTLRLYFGAKTIWYLQFHDVCAIILLSMGSFFIDKSSNVFFILTGRSSYYNTLEDFSSPVNLFGTTRLSRGFRVTRKDQANGLVFHFKNPFQSSLLLSFKKEGRAFTYLNICKRRWRRRHRRRWRS